MSGSSAEPAAEPADELAGLAPANLDEDRSANLGTLARCFEAIRAFDVDGVVDCMSADVRFELPFADPPSTRDRDGVRRLFELVRERFATFDLTLTDVSFDFADPHRLTVQYVGHCRTNQGYAYHNHYVGLIEFDQHAICRWQEFTNPLVVAKLNAQFVAE